MHRSAKINSRDTVIIGGLLAIILFAWFNLNDKQSHINKNTDLIVGSVISIEGGEGKQLSASNFFWTEVSKGQHLGANDSFMTGPNTTAEIQIGKSRIVLRPNTLIKLVKDDLIRFNDGQIVIMGKDLKVKTTAVIHKVSGEVTITTANEKDKVIVTTGEHTTVAEQTLEKELLAVEEMAQTVSEPLPPKHADYFMEPNWLEKQDIPKLVFINDESLTHIEWIRKVIASGALKGKIYMNGNDVIARYFLPLLSFDKEFEIGRDNLLIQKRLLNGTLTVNGESFDASIPNRVEMRPKKNSITLSHEYQRRNYSHYVDEEAEDIKVPKTKYEISEQMEIIFKDVYADLDLGAADAEEEEEEPRGLIKLEWEGKLKDNQIFVVRIRTIDGNTLVEDFAEDNHYEWTPPAPGKFELELSVKSTATEKVLKTHKSLITVNKADVTTPIVEAPNPQDPWKISFAAGSSFLSTSSKTDSDKVEVSGFGPFSARVGVQNSRIATALESSLFFADIPSENDNKFLNSRFSLFYIPYSVTPMFVYQKNKIIYSRDEVLGLKDADMPLIGVGYRFKISSVTILPSYLYNVGEFTGHQIGFEASGNLPTSFPLELILRGESNRLKKGDLESSTNQLTLMLGTSI